MTPVLPVAQVVPVPEDSLNARPNLKVAVLGAGGLGRGMAQMVQARRDFQLCAIADTTGYAFNEAGLCLEALMATKTVENYAAEASVVPSTDAIQALFEAHGSQLDAVFLALPNLPVDFFAKTLRRLAESGCFQGVLVDALKRTQAVEHLLPLDSLLRSQRMLYITGAGGHSWVFNYGGGCGGSVLCGSGSH
jgi:glycerol-3-phosphate dehydrogenase